MSHKPGSRLPLLSAGPAVTPTTLKRASTNSAGWWTGIIESDDVASLSLETEKALNYCKKCNVLVESVKRKDSLVRLCKSCYISWPHTGNCIMGVNSLPKTVTRQRRDCDLNPDPSAPESSMLTTRLPSHPYFLQGSEISLTTQTAAYYRSHGPSGIGLLQSNEPDLAATWLSVTCWRIDTATLPAHRCRCRSSSPQCLHRRRWIT